MPGYAIAKHNMDELREKYDAETKRVETEFNAKYEEFLDGQRTYAKTILEKRQAELRELMEKILPSRLRLPACCSKQRMMLMPRSKQNKRGS